MLLKTGNTQPMSHRFLVFFFKSVNNQKLTQKYKPRMATYNDNFKNKKSP